MWFLTHIDWAFAKDGSCGEGGWWQRVTADASLHFKVMVCWDLRKSKGPTAQGFGLISKWFHVGLIIWANLTFISVSSVLFNFYR